MKIKKNLKRIKKLIKYIIGFLILLLWTLKPKISSEKPTIFVFHAANWKQPYIKNYFEGNNIRFVPFNKSVRMLKMELQKFDNKKIVVWGYNEPSFLLTYVKENDIPFYRMEDGFIRSVGLGALHTPPYSLCIDKKGLYYDSTQPSELEDILNAHKFSSAERNRANLNIKKLVEMGVSKYNHLTPRDIDGIYGIKKRKRILVIGQVEDDQSIKKGCSIQITNNELVRLAVSENPEAEIIYKPHPDVLAGKREKQSNPNDVKHIAKVIEEPLSLVDSFKTIDHVYTITSLAGFEALIRGIKVTTVGAPFYSGWGLTDDRQLVSRRKRELTLEELFAGAYILYPKYVNPNNGKELEIEDVIDILAKQLKGN